MGLRDASLRELSPAQTDAAPSLSVTIDDLIVEAGGGPDAPGEFLAACRWTLRGTQPASPATEPRSVKIQGTWVSRAAGDQIVESWVWDTRCLTPLPRPTAPLDLGMRSCRRRAKAVVRHWLIDGWQAGDLGLVDECFATDYTHHDSGYFPEACGRADYKSWLQGCAPRPDLVVERLFAEGDRVVALLRWSGKQLGAIIYRVAGGEIQESWSTWDTQRLA
jgi:hypothetical protein